MCIRDRGGTSLLIVVGVALDTTRSLDSFMTMRNHKGFLAVSYTHLDVYKRQVWIKIFPDKPVTEKPAETRMGSGKGSPEYWVAVVKPGRVMFELADVDEATAREALRLAMHKLPIKCKFVVREDSVKEDGTNEG